MKRVRITRDHFMVVNKFGMAKIWGEMARTESKEWLVWDADTEKTYTFKTYAEAADYFQKKINS